MSGSRPLTGAMSVRTGSLFTTGPKPAEGSGSGSGSVLGTIFSISKVSGPMFGLGLQAAIFYVDARSSEMTLPEEVGP